MNIHVQVVFKKMLKDLFLVAFFFFCTLYVIKNLSKCIHSILGEIFPSSFSVYFNLFFVNCFMCNKVVVVDFLHSWVVIFSQMFKQILSQRVKTLSNTNVAVTRQIKREKAFCASGWCHSKCLYMYLLSSLFNYKECQSDL